MTDKESLTLMPDLIV